MGTHARKVTITGNVQGVGFRAWTKEKAEAAGLAGWVRNLPDGRVEAWLEGEGAAIDGLLTDFMDGPGTPKDASYVTVEPEGPDGFRILS